MQQIMDLEIYRQYGNLALENTNLIQAETNLRLALALERHGDYLRRFLMLQEYSDMFRKLETDSEASAGENFCKCSDFRQAQDCIHVQAYSQIFGGLLKESLP